MVAQASKPCRPRRCAGVFARRFLETGPELVVPDGAYDPQRQIFVRQDTREPAFVDDALCTRNGNEITTHFLTRVGDATFRDPDNG